MRTYKRQSNRGNVPLEVMKQAAAAILEHKLTTTEAAKIYQICRGTLARFIRIHKNDISAAKHCGFIKNRLVFTTEREMMLVQKLNRMATETKDHIDCQIVRSLAYDYAVENKISFPKAWEKDKKAGQDWLLGFFKRNDALLDSYVKFRRIFSKEHEKLFINEINSLNFGILPKDIRRLAYNYAIKNNIRIPEAWEKTGQASFNWWIGFYNRNESICRNVVIIYNQYHASKLENKKSSIQNDAMYYLYVCENNDKDESFDHCIMLDNTSDSSCEEFHSDEIMELLENTVMLFNGSVSFENHINIFTYIPKLQLLVYLKSIDNEENEVATEKL